MLRVLFLDQAGVPGGAELSMLDVAQHYANSSEVLLFRGGALEDLLRARRIRHSVMAAPDALMEVTREGPLLPSLYSGFALGSFARRVAQHARPFDVLYANSQKAFVVAALAARLVTRPLIWHLRDLLTADHFGFAKRRSLALLANIAATRVFANSHATRRAFISAGGRAKLAAVIHNGVDNGLFQTLSEADALCMKRELGVADLPVIGVFGRLAPWKGQHVVIDAVKSVPEVHVLIVGDALFGEVDYVRFLKRKVMAFGLGRRVHFLGFRRDVPELMQLVNVVVHCSTAPEPFGRVVVEGMLAGKPVIATRGGGPDEIIAHDETGYLVPAGDSSALASAIRHVLSNPSAGTAMGSRARILASRRFTLSAMVSRIDDELHRLSACAPDRRRAGNPAPPAANAPTGTTNELCNVQSA